MIKRPDGKFKTLRVECNVDAQALKCPDVLTVEVFLGTSLRFAINPGVARDVSVIPSRSDLKRLHARIGRFLESTARLQ